MTSPGHTPSSKQIVQSIATHKFRLYSYRSSLSPLFLSPVILYLQVVEAVRAELVHVVDHIQVNDGIITQRLRDVLVSMGIDLPSQDAYNDLMKENAAGIVVVVIRSFSDQEFSEQGAIAKALRTLESADAARTFLFLNQYRRLDDFKYHPPNLPCFGTMTILRSLQWCLSSAIPEKVTAVSFHALHQLFSDLHATPFVNEQFRLLNGIALLISICRRDFKDSTLLHLFMKSSLLLAQADLVPAARSLLEWGFFVYRKTQQADQILSDILIRVCALVNDHPSTRSADPL